MKVDSLTLQFRSCPLDMSGNFPNITPSDNRLMGLPIVNFPDAINNSLQWDSVNNVFVWVSVSGGSMGDLEFLRDKQLSGDLVSSTGTILAAAPATICSITPAIGKTFFLINVEQFFVDDGGGSNMMTTEIQNNGVNKQTSIIRAPNYTSFRVPSAIKGDSLIGNGIKIYRIQKIIGVVNTRVTATMQGWIQDT